MSKKGRATGLLIILLVTVALGALNLRNAVAQMGPEMNGGPDFTPLSIAVNSPVPNQAYDLSVNLIFTVTKPASWFTSGAPLYNYDCQGVVNFVRYSVDGQPSVTIPANDNYTGLSENPIPSTLNYRFCLQELSLGLHTITVSAQGEYDYWTGSPDYAYTHNTVIGNSTEILFFVGNSTFNWVGLSQTPSGTQSPFINILSPIKQFYAVNQVSLQFKVSTSENASLITDAWYTTDWKTDSIHFNDTEANLFNDNLTQLPEGNHTVTVYATASGSYIDGNSVFVFGITTNSSVHFTSDNVSPIISFPNSQNQKYSTSSITLNITSNKPLFRVIYSIDNQANATSNSNTTLTVRNLSNGEHKLVVYPQDEYGLIGDPSVLYFDTQASEFNSAIMIVVLVTAIAVVIGLGLVILYHRRHQKTAKLKQ